MTTNTVNNIAQNTDVTAPRRSRRKVYIGRSKVRINIADRDCYMEDNTITVFHNTDYIIIENKTFNVVDKDGVLIPAIHWKLSDDTIMELLNDCTTVYVDEYDAGHSSDYNAEGYYKKVYFLNPNTGSIIVLQGTERRVMTEDESKRFVVYSVFGKQTWGDIYASIIK